MDPQRRQQATSASTTVASVSSVSSASLTSASGATSLAIGITGGSGYTSGVTASASSVPANGEPGMIVFTQPPLQSTSFYKIAPGEYVTFGWNFTYLAVTPSAITVSAVCENGNTYPIGPTNGVIAGNAQSVVWYPYGYQTANPSLPLAQASYTLHIWGDGGESAIPTPGYLEPNSQLQFSLYTPQPYIPLTSGWQCAGCGAALAQFDSHPASIALITTLLVIFLSGFTTLRRVWD
ncbi:hypothetical protein PAXRUDRAFT_821256 [Paxillus rubicundulus Ve08.2h10]|uniref:DUF7137 domain-containing protein n=1 Tax=Paxillus rubicundulus Ve08.2h10 TaxID=930991 RepID=A0A0D0EAY2_9AGAM|nr:hypothetical protein PAXRUDRAFT_821256 [Paxillus rubicundulus Ve08.2h10]